MIRITFLILSFLFFSSSVVCADHWTRTGVFDPGTYIVCVVNQGEPVNCLMTVADGSVAEAQSNVDTLNEPPLTRPNSDYQIKWYRWDSGYWIKYKCPWKFIEGDVM